MHLVCRYVLDILVFAFCMFFAPVCQVDICLQFASVSCVPVYDASVCCIRPLCIGWFDVYVDVRLHSARCVGFIKLVVFVRQYDIRMGRHLLLLPIMFYIHVPSALVCHLHCSCLHLALWHAFKCIACMHMHAHDTLGQSVALFCLGFMVLVRACCVFVLCICCPVCLVQCDL